eukprot:scaffold10860_cov182-Amphora_coffeaeformis.AAC.15
MPKRGAIPVTLQRCGYLLFGCWGSRRRDTDGIVLENEAKKAHNLEDRTFDESEVSTNPTDSPATTPTKITSSPRTVRFDGIYEDPILQQEAKHQHEEGGITMEDDTEYFVAPDCPSTDYKALYFQALRNLSADRLVVKRKEKSLIRVAAQLAERNREVQNLRAQQSRREQELNQMRRELQRQAAYTNDLECIVQQQSQQKRDLPTLAGTETMSGTRINKKSPKKEARHFSVRGKQDDRTDYGAYFETKKNSHNTSQNNSASPSVELVNLVRSIEETMDRELEHLRLDLQKEEHAIPIGTNCDDHHSFY